MMLKKKNLQKNSKNFAHTFSRYPFESLLVATRYNTEPMDGLVRGNIRKESKTETTLSKIWFF